MLPPTEEPKDVPKVDVGCQTRGPDGKLGVSYTGKAQTTEKGFTCQKWTASLPHGDSMAWLGDHNYCRNTASGSDQRVWCYTTDPGKRWDFCPVPECPSKASSPLLAARLPEGGEPGAGLHGGVEHGGGRARLQALGRDQVPRGVEQLLQVAGPPP